MVNDFIRVGCATPEVRVADCEHNTEQIIKLIREAAGLGVSLILFPELSITSYTCSDLFLQSTLLEAAERCIIKVAQETAALDIISVVGLPLRDGTALYNCAAVVYRGKILGFVPKIHLPNYSEFEEARFFSEGCTFKNIHFNNETVPIGCDLIFSCANMPSFRFGVEICEDLWVANPPSISIARAGATVILNLSASNETAGKSQYRTNLVKGQSSRLFSAYMYCSAGQGESTTDLVFAGHNMIAENGSILAESERFTTGLITAELDLERVLYERRKRNTFSPDEGFHTVHFEMPKRPLTLTREFSPFPFVPQNTQKLCLRCEEILTIQAHGLVKRLQHTNAKTAVLGISGGLDSTLALLVTLRAFKILNLPAEKILAVTMPCFGTTDRTKSNAIHLAEQYDTSILEIPIATSVLQHFSDIHHDPNLYDTTYENAQARERTQVLMDLANQHEGLVVGTGDLSELALGWATYNGDHMSMYAVNCSVPKTLMHHLVAHEASLVSGEKRAILIDILNTPVSPELIPPQNKEIIQKTEDIVGPYVLHDFFLYYFLRFGMSPKKIFRMACIAFSGKYTQLEIKSHMRTFFSRFFSQQFKRSCLPDGPKIGSVSLSPRGDFRMPSDVCGDEWLREINGLVCES